jgi:hypothetical protein
MRAEHIQPNVDPAIHQAAAQLQRLIRARYPGATFAVAEGDDPEGTYVHVTVDVDDLTSVLETVADQLFAYQVEQELAIYVVPRRPLHRALSDLGAHHSPDRRAGRLSPIHPRL